MKKKIVILLVRRHAGEIDWIIPILHKFQNRYKIITIFSSKQTFDSLKRNIDLFNLWKSISYDYYIIRWYDCLIAKILHKIILYLEINNNKLFDKQILLSKTFDINSFLKKFKIHINDIKYIFTTIINFSYTPFIFKKKNKEILIIRYPETTFIIPSKKENPFLQEYKIYNSIKGDYFLFPSIHSKNIFLGSKNSKISKKIVKCGYPRYEKWWIKKILGKKNKQKKNNNEFKIIVFLRNPDSDYFQKYSYEEIIRSIMKLSTLIPKLRVVFKTHPHKTDINYLKKILSVYKKEFWSISNKHPMVLSLDADVAISIITSACLDSLSLKVPTIEFYNTNEEIRQSKITKTLMHMVFDKNKKKWKTIYEAKKFLIRVNNFDELKREVDLVFNKKKYLWKKKFNTVEKFFKTKYDVKYLFTFFEKKIKSKSNYD